MFIIYVLNGKVPDTGAVVQAVDLKTETICTMDHISDGVYRCEIPVIMADIYINGIYRGVHSHGDTVEI